MPKAVTLRVALTLLHAVAVVTAMASLAYAAGFIGGFWTPTRLDAPVRDPAPAAALVNLALLAGAASAHLVMGEAACRAWWRRWLPADVLGVLRILGCSLGLGLLLWQWRPMGGVVWEASAPVLVGLLYALYGLGWSLLLVAGRAPFRRLTFPVTRQTSLRSAERVGATPRAGSPGPTSRVRWPLYPGLLLVAWSTPTMTAAHLVLACAVTAWVGVARSFADDRVPTDEDGAPARVRPGREHRPAAATGWRRREGGPEHHNDGWAA